MGPATRDPLSAGGEPGVFLQNGAAVPAGLPKLLLSSGCSPLWPAKIPLLSPRGHCPDSSHPALSAPFLRRVQPPHLDIGASSPVYTPEQQSFCRRSAWVQSPHWPEGARPVLPLPLPLPRAGFPSSRSPADSSAWEWLLLTSPLRQASHQVRSPGTRLVKGGPHKPPPRPPTVQYKPHVPSRRCSRYPAYMPPLSLPLPKAGHSPGTLRSRPHERQKMRGDSGPRLTHEGTLPPSQLFPEGPPASPTLGPGGVGSRRCRVPAHSRHRSLPCPAPSPPTPPRDRPLAPRRRARAPQASSPKPTARARTGTCQSGCPLGFFPPEQPALVARRRR